MCRGVIAGPYKGGRGGGGSGGIFGGYVVFRGNGGYLLVSR